ncbi:hypothetical protein J4438_03330 [Candidatus Woesearchaeota archaeon]|nr:hypothetical protein [Candidatus Woesearchaeota archaeon]
MNKKQPLDHLLTNRESKYIKETERLIGILPTEALDYYARTVEDRIKENTRNCSGYLLANQLLIERMVLFGRAADEKYAAESGCKLIKNDQK